MQTPKLIQINTVCNVSTGHIMGEIQKAAESDGFITLSIFGRRKGFTNLPCRKIGNPISFWLHVALTTVFDLHGMGSYFVTKKIIRVLRNENPDIIHLHNMHGYYLNYPLLFAYLKNEYKGKIFWTFHDCWPFTGHCAFYTMAACEKWRNGCNQCPNKKEYPISLIKDSSSHNYRMKKEYFTGIRNLTIIVPSEWMNRQVQYSFMKEYRVKTIHNGIDTKIFQYHENNDVYKKYGINEDKKIILGVAAYWTERKGLDDFVELARHISDDYVIVLVGLSLKQQNVLPSNIIGIQRTESREELAKIYSASYIFMNPSIEESFSMVTVEAMACGLPVIALDTSAVGELVDQSTGIVLHTHTSEDFMSAIGKIKNLIDDGTISRSKITSRAQNYSVKIMTEDIIDLYNE